MNETLAAPKAAADLIAGFQPGFLGRISQMHGEYYAKAWGSGPGFEALMARELGEFFERYDPARDLLLTAHVEGQLVGSIAIDGSQEERPGEARLRWFLLDEAFQGRGIGRHMLERSLDFCRRQGFSTVYLWTVEGLAPSRHLYEQAGFRVVERFIDSRYTVEHTQLRFELPLR